MEKKEFYGNGKYEKFSEVNGVKEGKAIYYWRENSIFKENSEDYGKIREEFIYENGVKQGKATIYFDVDKTQKIKEEFNYIDNIKEGVAYLVFSNKVEKRYYTVGKLSGKAFVYNIDGSVEIKDYDRNRANFRSLKEILGIELNEDEKMDEKEYEIFKSEAERYFKEVADLYKISGKREYSISKSFIKNYCSKARE